MNTKKQRKKWLKPVILCALVLAVIVLVCVGIWSFMNWDKEQNQQNTTVEDAPAVEQDEATVIPVATKEELLAEVNKRRAEAGVAPLQYSPELEATAQAKCDDMVARNYYNHLNPDGVRGIDTIMNYTSWIGYFNENLMKQSQINDSAEAVLDGWMNSEAHRNELLNSIYTLTGFGVCGDTAPNSAANPTYFVEHFYGP